MRSPDRSLPSPASDALALGAEARPTDGTPSQGSGLHAGGPTDGGQGAKALPARRRLLGEPPRGVQVLDWAGFRAAVSYTFDDSNSSQIENYDRLNALGVPLTFYLWTAKPESSHPIWARAVQDGHELGNHSHSHRQHGKPAALLADIDRASEFLEQRFGVHPWTMAAPYGSRDYVAVAEQRFFLNRGVAPGLVLPDGDSNPMYLDCFVPRAGVSAAELNGRLDAARSRGGWEIVLTHGFEGGKDQAYQPYALHQFEQAVRYATSFDDVWVGTLLDVGAYWLGQRAFALAARESSEQGDVYRWTLPAHFPPGKFLRVVSASAELTQGGRPVPRSEGGYFDIALDALELTAGRESSSVLSEREAQSMPPVASPPRSW